MQWITGRVTLFDSNNKPVAEVARIGAGWCWYIGGSDAGGDVETVSEAMEAAERALGIKPMSWDTTANRIERGEE